MTNLSIKKILNENLASSVHKCFTDGFLKNTIYKVHLLFDASEKCLLSYEPRISKGLAGVKHMEHNLNL